MTKYVGLIGYPLGHSVSPAMHQAAFDHYKLDIRYELWETEASELVTVVERLRRPETLGANVTVPHKEAMIPFMDELDDLALEVGAVNTIVNRGGRLVGYNTDAGGFLKALRQKGGFNPAGKRAVLVGAGGVARAAGFALARAGVKSLVIADIITERARGLASDLERSLARTQGPPPRSCVDAPDMGGIASLGFETWPAPEIRALSPDDPQFEEAISRCDLLVNCTPVGMRHSSTEGKSPVEAKLIPKGALVYDMVYNPLETPLLTDAKKAGARTLSGLAMLVYQGAMSFELWTGKEAPIDIMFNVAKKALAKETEAIAKETSDLKKKSGLRNYLAGLVIFLTGLAIFISATITVFVAGLDLQIDGMEDIERIVDWMERQVASLAPWSWPPHAWWLFVIGGLGICLMVVGFLLLILRPSKEKNKRRNESVAKEKAK